MDTHKIQAAGLTGKLYQDNDSPRWQLEFRHPHTRRRLRISTGLRDLVMAKEKAKGILVDAGREGLAALQAHQATRRAVALVVPRAVVSLTHTLAICITAVTVLDMGLGVEAGTTGAAAGAMPRAVVEVAAATSAVACILPVATPCPVPALTRQLMKATTSRVWALVVRRA
jgi:hypothetical protein